MVYTRPLLIDSSSCRNNRPAHVDFYQHLMGEDVGRCNVLHSLGRGPGGKGSKSGGGRI